jgi:hypothetical protein
VEASAMTGDFPGAVGSVTAKVSADAATFDGGTDWVHTDGKLWALDDNGNSIATDITNAALSVTLAAAQPNYAPATAASLAAAATSVASIATYLTTNLGSNGANLSKALDAVLIESGISASAALTTDANTQLTSVNARQALAIVLSAAAGVLAGAAPNSNPLTIQPGGNAAGNTRISGTVDNNGNRTAVALKVPV